MYKHINSRMKLVFLFVLLIFILIILKVFYIEVFSYNKLNENANNLWSRNLPIGSDRGKILDRNGKIIAGNATTTSLVFIHNQIKDKKLVEDIKDSPLYIKFISV